MEFVMTIGNWIATQIAEYTLQPIVRQVCYVVQYKSNIKDLQTQVDNLASLKDRVKHKVEEAFRSNEKIQRDVEKWLENVDETLEEANKFFEEEDQSNKKCLHGFCPNPKPRHQLSRKSTKIKEEVVKLQTDGEKYTTQPVSYLDALQVTWNTSITCEAFESRTSIMDSIIKELAKPDINIIGVYGLGGVGKTTLVKQVYDHVRLNGLFDELAMATVSQNPDPNKIQGEIAEQLGLKFEQEETAGRALSLIQRTKDKKILIILDDIWTKLKLDVLGLIPAGGCKILAASRTREVLSETGTQNEFNLKVLDERESWNLFEKKAADVVVKDPAIRNIAFEVAKRCSGLPVLIISVASSLRSKNIYSWRVALKSLKKFDKNGLQEKAYSILEWSYNQLRDGEVKSIFLLCPTVLVQNTVHLTYLLKYSFGLGLLENVDTLDEARDRLYTLVDYLKDSCLLVDGDDDQHPEMHDLVCDVALYIAKKEHQVLSVAYGNELKEWPNKDFLENCTMIYFPYGRTIPAGLPAKLQCPKLKLFILANNNDDQSLEVSENLFEEMKELKVLDLTNFRNLLLPPCFLSLTKLQTLCLEDCEFGDDDDVLAKIGKLRGLQILSLARSRVGKLCKEIGQLTCLRLLDLSDCDELEVIPPKVISNLSKLEELNMESSFKNWEAEGVTDEKLINASVSELKHLSQLTTLNVSVVNVDVFPTNLFSDKLERFIISVGHWHSYGSSYYGHQTSKQLKLKLTRSDQLDQSVIMLMKKSKGLYLDLQLEGVSNCIPQLDSEGFPQLKHLGFENHAGGMKHIIESINSAFPNLESLVLKNVSSVESVCYAQLGTGSFGKLRTINVRECDGLKNLFPFSMVNCFLQLHKMTVDDCNILEEIFVEEKEDKSFIHQQMDPINEFCQLKVLNLERLPQFIGFSSIGGNNSAPLFNWKVKFPKSLEYLNIFGLNRLTSIWPDHDQVAPPEFTSKLTKLSAADQHLNSCRNLRTLEIMRCETLKYVFPASAARGLEQLVKLRVENCSSIKEIIAKEDGDHDDQIIKFVFPKVEKIYLQHLPQLRSFYPGMHTSKWPSLTSMVIYGCEKVEILAADISTLHPQNDRNTTNPNPLFFIEKDSFPNLDNLEMPAECLSIVSLNHAEWFPKLAELNLMCMHLKSAVFPFASFLKLQALQNLTVQRAFFKEIFTVEQVSGLVNGGLTHLRLFKLPKLMRLWDENSLALQHHAAAPPVFPNMENVEVEQCRSLKNLVPFAISFPNLKALDLYKCHGLNYLFTYSVATSLTKLESLDIGNCKRMTEIISVPSTSCGDDDHDLDHTITFGGLIILRLYKLPSLAGFCSGNSINVKVPLLQDEDLQITDCGLGMEISPDGILVIIDSKSAERSLHIAEEEEAEEEEEEEDDDNIVYERLEWMKKTKESCSPINVED